MASAPGRVNLMGDHTDYNEGLVLPMPIPQQTTVRLRTRSDRIVSVRSSEQAERGEYELGKEQRTGSWVDYVQGITVALAQRGLQLRGFEAELSSQVPVGAGLSSSAALEIATSRALREAFAFPLDDVELARIGQQAEVEFVGAPTGLMDQLASSLGEQGKALQIDIRTLQTRSVTLPDALELVVIDSGVKHAHGGVSGYRERRSECDRACEQLGVRSLRDVTLADLEGATLLDETLRRRVRHVISENARVEATVAAFERADLGRLRALFAASHESLRDDYQVSVPEIDRLVELGMEHPDVIAARLTGGGFGGSVVMLAQRGRAGEAAREIVARHRASADSRATQLLPP